MLPSDMISLLKAHGYDDLDDTAALELLNDAQNAVATAEPWPELEKTVDIATDAGSNTTSHQPTDLAAVLSLVDLDNRNKLQPITRQEYMNRYFDVLDETGNACHYFMFAGKLNIVPAPPSPVTLRLDYIMRPPDMTTDDSTEPLWLPRQHHRLFVMHALVAASQLEGDLDIAEQFQNDFDRRLSRARQDLWKKQYDRPKMVRDVYENDIYW